MPGKRWVARGIPILAERAERSSSSETTLDDVEPCNSDSAHSVQSCSDTTCSFNTMTLRTELVQ